MAATLAGVIGYPLAHSISPEFQQPAFDHLGLAVTYRAYEVPPNELPAFVARLRGGQWVGINVTIPHKQAVFQVVDEMTEEARQIGAVNTVICRDGRLLGDNTDAAGFLRALAESGFEIAGKQAVMLGAGGAAKAVAVGLLRAGARHLAIANRTVGRAEALATTLAAHFSSERVSALPLEPGALAEPLRAAALVVNTTSVGMAHGPAPDASPLPAPLLGSHLLVYDLVYNPARTRLLAEAAAAGARTVEGLPMLVYQGAASFERWTGQPAPVSIMMEAGRKALAQREAATRQHR
jgi:shikimate dehydrogenase